MKKYAIMVFTVVTLIHAVPQPSMAEMSESERCEWASVRMCSTIGLSAGAIGGFLCGFSMKWFCNYAPLAPTDKWGRPTCH
jgi:hypothetical protein